MAKVPDIKNQWSRLNELTKILIIVLLTLFLVWLSNIDGNGRNVPGIELDKNGIPRILGSNGKPLNLIACTEAPGKNQCEIFKDRFVTENVEEIHFIRSRKPNNIRCCTTVYYGGEPSQECEDYDGLPFCPIPGQVPS